MGNGLSKSGSATNRWSKKKVIKDKKVGNGQKETNENTPPVKFVEAICTEVCWYDVLLFMSKYPEACVSISNKPRLDAKIMSESTKTSSNQDAITNGRSHVMNSSELYNLVIAETWQGAPQIAQPYSILLIDCSCGSEKSIDTRKLVSTSLGKSQLEHYILDCSVSAFLANYPFLSCSDPCTSTHIPSSRLKTMPSEIIAGRLYQGNANHATDLSIISSLNISHIVNITMEQPNKFPDQVQYLKVPLDDISEEDLLSWLPKIISFMKSAILEKRAGDSKSNGVVLVHCNLGRSRSSTAVLGYLMSIQNMSLLEACNFLKDCRPTARPNAGFLEQLLKFESNIGRSRSTFSELPF